jgi:hypothetical protein
VKHRTNPKFWRCYERLPPEIQELADKTFDLLKADPRHPSLHFKKVGRLWSVRVGIHYRALGAETSDDLIWFWIGRHDEYDRLIGLRG